MSPRSSWSSARLKQPAAAGNRTLLDLLTDDVLIDSVNTPPVAAGDHAAAFDNQFRALRLLHTMSLFLGTLEAVGRCRRAGC